MTKKIMSTFEREMKNPKFRKSFKKGYRDFLLSELLIAMMEGDKKSVRALAKEASLSPTAIQKLRSGNQEDIKLSNFINISHACGFHVVLEKGEERINLG
jgi:DNA-binding Xre family transcriptional regulator